MSKLDFRMGEEWDEDLGNRDHEHLPEGFKKWLNETFKQQHSSAFGPRRKTRGYSVMGPRSAYPIPSPRPSKQMDLAIAVLLKVILKSFVIRQSAKPECYV